MKIRQGFVSNSSSTSFCIYGYRIECSVDGQWAKSDEVEPKLEGTKLEITNGQYDCIYVGRDLSSMEDDITYGDFKLNISDEVEDIFGEDAKCFVYEDGWYEG